MLAGSGTRVSPGPAERVSPGSARTPRYRASLRWPALLLLTREAPGSAGVGEPMRSPMTQPRFTSPPKRLETWLWTGPVGHLAGGAVDFAEALAGYLLARALRRTIR